MNMKEKDYDTVDGKYSRDYFFEAIEKQGFIPLKDRREKEVEAFDARQERIDALQQKPAIQIQMVHKYQDIVSHNASGRNALEITGDDFEKLTVANAAMQKALASTIDIFALPSADIKKKKKRCQNLRKVLEKTSEEFPFRKTIILQWGTGLQENGLGQIIEECQSIHAILRSAKSTHKSLQSLLSDFSELIQTLSSLPEMEDGPVTGKLKEEAIQKLHAAVVLTRGIQKGDTAASTKKYAMRLQQILEEQIFIYGMKKIGLDAELPADPVTTQHAEAQQDMIELHMPLILGIAKGFVGRGVSLHDLFQQGCLFFLERSGNHDPEKGSLSTYLVPYLKKHLAGYIRNQKSIIHVNNESRRLAYNILRAHERNRDQMSAEESVMAVADHFGVSLDEVYASLRIAKTLKEPVSLESYVPDTEYEVAAYHETDPAEMWGRESHKWQYLKDVIPYPGDPEGLHVTEVHQTFLRETVSHVLRTLTYREREIVKLRYGLQEGHEYSLDEVASIFKVTRERVRQIECRAVSKLQHPHRANRLVDFVENDVQQRLVSSQDEEEQGNVQDDEGL